ncbi:salicylate hydroxylase [Rhodoferax ferrireducens]|uniref:Salicylate hydroxylase n=2 Tax=Rhodoferax ferrireducens TaxID=192843 RepID=A0ABU2C7S0_9BURK|nr:salicylate hydroxylase [Rhodoferax ferrireducens]
MAAALAGAKAGWEVQLMERASTFSEIGAGIQIGPNVTRLLYRWGLQHAVDAVAAFPQRLQVRDALSARELGVLTLGATIQQRYGAPYAAIHRADLHALLHSAVARHSGTTLLLNQDLQQFGQTRNTVTVRSASMEQYEGDALVGADGLWSPVRQWLLGDSPPRATGHLAYRALVRQSDLPAALRSQQVTAWLGPRLHAIQYPVRGGDWLNLVAFVQGQLPGQPTHLDHWDHSANAADLRTHLAQVCTPLQDILHAITAWRLWVLYDRPPMQGPHQHAQGRVALLGDAAHPMRPYLAQGAGMAIEDAATLGQVLEHSADIPAALAQYAQQRWQRNARVQARSLRNGKIFHAQGLLRWGRNRAMQLGGERLMDLPWLYGGGLTPQIATK